VYNTDKLNGAEGLLEKLIVALPFPFVEHQHSLPFSHGRATSSIWSHMSRVNFITSSSLRPLLILSFYPCLGLPNVLFPSGFLTKTLYFSSLPCVLVHIHLILLDLITLLIFGNEYRFWSSLFCSLASCYSLFFSLKYPLHDHLVHKHPQSRLPLGYDTWSFGLR